jgi:hypothetical protein
VQDGSGSITKAVCQWTDEPPEGWNRISTAKDGRGVFARNGSRRKRRHYPDYVELVPQSKPDIPQWCDRVASLESATKGSLVLIKPDLGGSDKIYQVTALESGKRQGVSQLLFTLTAVGGLGTMEVPASDLLAIATYDPKTGAKEQQIEYLYPDEDGNPRGRVVRCQWTDRRPVYDDRGRKLKSKQIRPSHWVGAPTSGFWNDRGKGDKPWILYREAEALEEIARGGIVFAVAGEQAVEPIGRLG